MRHRAYILCAFAGAIAGMLGAARPAAAQSPWYIEGSAGALWRLDASRSTTFFNSSGTSGPGTNTLTFDPGPVVNLGVGYKLSSGFRIEGEVGYAHYMVANASPLSTNGAFPSLNGRQLSLQSGGGRSQYFATANAFYDLPFSGRIVPYVGGGVGVVASQAQVAVFVGPGGVPRFTVGSGNATQATILGEVGATVRLDPRWSVVPSYRFQHVFTNSGAFRDEANIYKLGIRYSF